MPTLLRTIPFLPSKRYNPETLDFQDRVLAAGGSLPVTTLDSVEKFVRDCKNAVIWDRILDCGLFVGSNLAAALVKLKYPGGGQSYLTNFNFVSGDFTERGASGGLKGNGATKYLSTALAPAAAGMTPGDHHLAIYNNHNTWAAAYYDAMGATDAASRVSLLRASGSDSNRNYLYPDNQNSGLATNISQNTSGLFCGSNGILYRNGSVLGTNGAAPSGNMPNIPYFLFALNSSGTPGALYDKRICFYSAGLGLTAAQAASLYNAVQALQTALGRSV